MIESDEPVHGVTHALAWRVNSFDYTGGMPNAKLIDDSYKFLIDAVEMIQMRSLGECCCVVVNDHRFKLAPAAAKKHQAYQGGLVVHTAEVLDTALRMAKSPHLKVNLDVLITAAIYHDYGKIYDYIKNPNIGKVLKGEEPEYVYTSHRHFVRHLSRSYAEFIKHIHETVPSSVVEQIGHCILAHHGHKDWGSPVEPASVEAFILHYADNLSAKCSLVEYIRE